MVKRTGSRRRKTRDKLSKNIRAKGKISISRAMRAFKDGENVVLKAEPAFHKGMYHPRFHGLHGRIVGKRGRCYEVEIKDGNKTKKLIVNPIHLKG